MLRVPRLWQRSCQLGFECAGGPDPVLKPAKLLAENDCGSAVELGYGGHSEHVRVLAGEQLPQKSASSTTANVLAYLSFLPFRG